jgi:hypothetical protein
MKHKKSKYIKQRVKYWGPEFCLEILKIPHTKEMDKLVKMACYTMVHDLALNFKDGEFHDEILKHYGILDKDQI